MRRALAIVVAAGCHATPPRAPSLDPPPPRGVLAPRNVKVVKIEAHPAPAKQRWLATFEPDAGTLATAIATYRADLVAAKIEVTGFDWEPRALDFSIGTGDDRLDVFVRPNDDDRTFSIAVDAPGR